jgi:hypothetical protein
MILNVASLAVIITGLMYVVYVFIREAIDK